MTQAVLDSEQAFVRQSLKAAIVICRTEHDTLHTGVLHRSSDGSAPVLHLGWQDKLFYQWPWQRLWAAPDVEPEKLAIIGAWCRLIWKEYESKRKFPYGIKFSETRFSDSGELILGPGEKGLTCATFVLAIFNAAGIDLIDEDDWPVRQEEDRAFLSRIKQYATPAHFAALTQEVEAGCKRIRPEEVVGACVCQLPAKFEPSSKEGARINAVLFADSPNAARSDK